MVMTVDDCVLRISDIIHGRSFLLHLNITGLIKSNLDEENLHNISITEVIMSDKLN